ncbi:histidinol-phosphate transaminase [Romeria aff. gracilis LEGE 07310]|uniref:Histidinol-phosphate aminotransferase n=1 Tax=Vasconcelosia minhoensis LEGE 07310 TaxID=915328 RepID=A0A8J7DSC4_9CYAN|nr:histidinol-phosphate transaminase [Romeria gracilis]MBE9080014.1 histidinol-phosphate transaminase [Romeria aff. gracilis LEGE 07310]
MTRLFRPAVNAMRGYVPGEQPKPGSPILKLNSNENPYPPSPKAMAALRSLDSERLRRYPDPFAREFCQAVSDALDVPADWVIVGNGSDDLLNLLIRACAEDDTRQVVYPMPTYVLYRTLAEIQSSRAAEVPYADDFRLPLEALVAAAGAVTLIATPNSPSGHCVPIAELRQLAQRLPGILAIDEAYVDFADQTPLALVREFDNVIVLRTLSKGYSLAGLRLGFAIANPSLLSGLFKVKDSYNVDAVAIAVGAAAIRDQAYKNHCVAQIRTARTQLATTLEQLGFTVWPSQTNFLLVRPAGAKAETLYQQLKSQNILVRYFNQPGLDDKLRITIGTGEQNHTLVQAINGLLG